ncbi:MAG: N-acetylmuramoyl-L-alanine amidase [Alphaproteobacteria bacterium]|nr:N-acetylmuramoyl-L-alanine amidase [Alphaproteobacteria bacterium]
MTRKLIPDNICHLPHFRKRTEPIKYIIIHCSRSNPSQQLETLNRLGLSVHYIIGRDGNLTEALEINKVAYHAGTSKWNHSQGPSLNGSSIGIELECPDMGQHKKSYPHRQIMKLCELLNYLLLKYKLRRENILGHSDIAPTRKPDPGVGFPWIKLYNEGLILPHHKNCLHPSTDEIFLLDTIGYDTSVLPAARYAFCRRWLPEEVIIEDDLQHLLDNPYPPDFIPQDYKKYIKRLRAIAVAYEQERRLHFWYEK